MARKTTISNPNMNRVSKTNSGLTYNRVTGKTGFTKPAPKVTAFEKANQAFREMPSALKNAFPSGYTTKAYKIGSAKSAAPAYTKKNTAR